MKKLLLILALTLAPAASQAACTMASGGVGLCYPNFGDSGAVWAASVRNNFVILNSSVPVATSSPTYTNLTLSGWVHAASSATALAGFYGDLYGKASGNVLKAGDSMTGGLSINAVSSATTLTVLNQRTSATNTGANIQAVGSGATENIALWLEGNGATKNTAIFISSPAAGANNYAIHSQSLAQSKFFGTVTAPSFIGALTGNADTATTATTALSVPAYAAALSTAAYLGNVQTFTAAQTMSGPLTVASSVTVTGNGEVRGAFEVDGAVDFDGSLTVASATITGITNSVHIGDSASVFPVFATFKNSSGNLNIGKERASPTAIWASGGLPWSGSITTTGAYPLQLGTNEVPHLNILNGGNVGIGVAAPLAKMTVAQQVTEHPDTNKYGQIEATLTDPAYRISMGYDATANGGFLQAIVNASSYRPIFINPRGGNVGVGTTKPLAKLDIQSGEYNGGSALMLGADIGVATSRSANTRKIAYVNSPHYSLAASSVAILWQDNDATANTLFIGGGNGYENAATRIGFWTGATNTTAAGTERFTILGNGNVGIGTTAPTHNFQVNGSIGAVGIDASSITVSGTSDFGFVTSTHTCASTNIVQAACPSGYRAIFAGCSGSGGSFETQLTVGTINKCGTKDAYTDSTEVPTAGYCGFDSSGTAIVRVQCARIK